MRAPYERNVTMTISGDQNDSPSSTSTTKPNVIDQSKDKKEGDMPSNLLITVSKQRKKLGRSARRRNAKQRAIQQMSSVPSDTDHKMSTSIVWPGVLQRRQEYNSFVDAISSNTTVYDSCTTAVVQKSDRDRRFLQRQLGYLPGNALRIVATHRSSTSTNSTAIQEDLEEEPTVLQLYPLVLREAYAGGRSDGRKFKSRQRGTNALRVDKLEEESSSSYSDYSSNTPHHVTSKDQEGTPRAIHNNIDWRTSDGNFVVEPFPTIYWITCPRLRSHIGRLEEEGRISVLEARLRNDTEALQLMVEAHTIYRSDRWALLTTTDQEQMSQRNWNFVGGIAGIQRYDTIKCLHSHVAHYLAKGPSSRNIVGQWVIEALEKEFNYLA